MELWITVTLLCPGEYQSKQVPVQYGLVGFHVTSGCVVPLWVLVSIKTIPKPTTSEISFAPCVQKYEAQVAAKMEKEMLSKQASVQERKGS